MKKLSFILILIFATSSLIAKEKEAVLTKDDAYILIDLLLGVPGGAIKYDSKDSLKQFNKRAKILHDLRSKFVMKEKSSPDEMKYFLFFVYAYGKGPYENGAHTEEELTREVLEVYYKHKSSFLNTLLYHNFLLTDICKKIANGLHGFEDTTNFIKTEKQDIHAILGIDANKCLNIISSNLTRERN